MINILCVHPLEGNAYELFKAFNRNKEVNIISLLEKKQVKSTFLDKIKYKMRIPADKYDVNKKLLSYDLSNINILFIIKGNEIKPQTIKLIKNKFPSLKLINWSQDDMYAKHNRSFFYTFSLKFYDLIVTQKSYNVKELVLIGAKKVLFQNKAYSKDIHVPCNDCDNKYKDKVVFIGFPEKERNESMLYLAKNGIKIDIYGYPEAWKKINYYHENITIHSKSLYGKDYSEALSCAKISLCFLRKINRDLQTSRSIEIPACRGFMIAERTNEHLDLFEEDKEAVYFNDDKELLQKVNYYLENEQERLRISNNGYYKSITKDYSYDNRINEILKMVEAL
jgi:spore maturation protein CgeB